MPTEFKALAAACAVGVFLAVGLVWEMRDAAIDPLTGQVGGSVQPLTPEGATTAPRASSSPTPARMAPITVPESDVESTDATPVIIGRVKPWVEIARMPAYAQANHAGREAIRDLYWNVCVEAQIPPEQRDSAYTKFAGDWTRAEPNAAAARARTAPSSSPQPGKPTPVSAETMRRWCAS